MWHRTNESKPPLSSSEPPVPPAPAPFERPAPAPAPDPRQLKTLLGRGLVLKGEISGGEDVTIEGVFEGQIRVSGAGVTIGANGRVTAEIEADEIIVDGRLEGSLRANQRITIRRSGNVTGNLETPRLLIEDGAILRGRVAMARPGEALAGSRSAGTTVPRAERTAFHPMPVPSETVS